MIQDLDIDEHRAQGTEEEAGSREQGAGNRTPEGFHES
jgi:hypothetical protein